MSVPAGADEENFECTLVLFGAQSGCGLSDIISSDSRWNCRSSSGLRVGPGRLMSHLYSNPDDGKTGITSKVF
jgi:hypothetical protein